jgi:hypothetical protein
MVNLTYEWTPESITCKVRQMHLVISIGMSWDSYMQEWTELNKTKGRLHDAISYLLFGCSTVVALLVGLGNQECCWPVGTGKKTNSNTNQRSDSNTLHKNYDINKQRMSHAWS